MRSREQNNISQILIKPEPFILFYINKGKSFNIP